MCVSGHVLADTYQVRIPHKTREGEIMSKIRENQAVFIGNNENQIGYIGRNSVLEKAKEKQEKQDKSSGNVFAGDLDGKVWENIQKKKALARKEATKVITDKFAADNQTSDKIKELDSHQEELKQEASTANEYLNYFYKEKEKLQEMYGVTEDYAPGSNAEYEERLEALYDEVDYWQEIKDDALTDIMIEGQVIGALKQAKLGEKYTMKNAMDDAEEILDAASREIIGLLQNEAMEHVKEEMEEKVEKAEEAAQEKEEQEEKLEKSKETKEEQESRTENLHDMIKEQSQVQETIEEIKKEADLLDEDLKGLLVDINVY